VRRGRGRVAGSPDLERSSLRVASALAAAGVGAGDLVAVRLERSAASVAAVYGVLLAGAGYVPIELEAPAARVAAILADCKPRALLASASALGELSLALPSGVRPVALEAALASPTRADRFADARPGDPAYVLYTSGSTGAPKGVVIEHRGSLAFLRWALKEFALRPGDRVANLAPLQFDLSVFDLFAARAAGAEVHVVSRRDGLFPAEIARYLRRRRITVFYSVPSVLASVSGALARARGAFPDLRLLLSAGEPLSPELAAGWRAAAPNAVLYNLYGPTETNVCAAYRLPAAPPVGAAVPIGRAAAGARLDVRRGELWVSGPSVMRGYMDPKLDRAAFGRSGAKGRRFYRTGDLVARRRGLLYFLGRRDGLVKVSGRRVELGEVEAAVRRHPAVSDAAVIHEAAGLAAFVVARGGRRLRWADLRRALAADLPSYMIPARFERRLRLPTLASGKLDRGSLA